MDVLAGAKSGDQLRVAGHVGQHPQLDLGVVGRQENEAVLRDERFADAAAGLLAHRDVLQVGVGRGQPPGGRAGRMVGGVDTTGVGVDQPRKRVDVGALQLGQLTVFEQASSDGVLVPQLLERLGVGRRRSALGRLALGREAQPLEQHLAELLGRVRIELDAGQLVDLPARAVDGHRHLARHARQ